MRWVLALAPALVACGGSPGRGPSAPAEGGVGLAREAPAAFAYDSLDERSVTLEALRGRPLVLTFVSTADLGSQAQVNYLVAMAKRDGERVGYALVVLEPRTNRELVEIYRSKLGIPFPVALADADEAGKGPFGPLDTVPTIAVLDRRGRVVWLRTGLRKPDEIRAALRITGAR